MSGAAHDEVGAGSTGCRVAIVADDLTGALDAAAPFAARGADAREVLAPSCAMGVERLGWNLMV
ncbi:hypothetical protein LY622_13340 [Halomonas sp. M5N1S17]|uniref:hypothetical protein n=1 Tax=Halomonas alkalisoli TaxID=2907158 RepID=UPI001F2C9BEC|nr:hypothetical protein [Halomonas alkalisoli]MCE9664422.1 hypothetical protein [Halomonas alkalisoli]